jgi:hypothetical protein
MRLKLFKNVIIVSWKDNYHNKAARKKILNLCLDKILHLVIYLACIVLYKGSVTQMPIDCVNSPILFGLCCTQSLVSPPTVLLSAQETGIRKTRT